MHGLPFTTTALEGDVAAAVAQIPAAAGVGEILGPEGRSLLVGRPASLRRWAATHLGLGRPRRKGARPPTDLRPVAKALRHLVTTSGFQQRLVYERVMSRHVPLSSRRDLRAPAWLHLDPSERFPRVTIRVAPGAGAPLFGPFRDRRAADRALQSLHKLFPLRPCDYVFEPDPALPLGLGCLYAQVRTCAAPCLVRATEEAYRALAAEAASFLARAEDRPPTAAEWLPQWVSRAEVLGLVIEQGKAGLELYPLRDGAVVEDAALVATSEDLRAALSRLDWQSPPGSRDDRPWLSAWLYAPRRTGAFLVVPDPADTAALEVRAREALGLAEAPTL